MNWQRVARELALALAEKLDLVGMLAVEMFLLPDNTLLMNQIAPRPRVACGSTSMLRDTGPLISDKSRKEQHNLLRKSGALWQSIRIEKVTNRTGRSRATGNMRRCINSGARNRRDAAAASRRGRFSRSAKRGR